MLERPAALGRLTLFALILSAPGCAPNDPPATGPTRRSEEGRIRDARIEQNDAIRAGDFERVASYWTEDVTIRAGLGFTLNGRAEYRAAFGRDTSVVYERTPDRIEANGVWPLAWEEGTWVGSRRADASRLISGRYAAQWIRIEDSWLIRSEVFVALECEGEGCGWQAVPP